jgi:hypothetical protein
MLGVKMSRWFETFNPKVSPIPGIRIKGDDLQDSDIWPRIRSYKGLAYEFESIKTEADGLRESIYWDWYHTARLSKIIWFANKRGVLPKDKLLKSVCKDFVGAIEQGNFEVWAEKFARSLFAEAKHFDLVFRYDPSNPPDEISLDDYLILAIPLTVSRSYLILQILNFLGKYHPGRNLNVLQTAHTSKYKLSTLLFRRPVLEVERLVFIYKTLYPETQLWVIADRLKLAPNNLIRDDRFSEAKKVAINRLNSVAGRHLYKVKRRILNVERGSFPNCTEVDISNRKQFFGREFNTDFKQATIGTEGEICEWRQWIFIEYHPWLVRQVLKRNNFDKDKVLPSSIVDFLSGKKNAVKFKS